MATSTTTILTEGATERSVLSLPLLGFRFILDDMQEQDSFSLDTHVIVKNMIAAGFTEAQAEVQADTLSHLIRYNLATKDDVARVERSIAELRKETKIEIEGVRKEIAELRKDTKTDIALLSRDLTIRLGGSWQSVSVLLLL